MTEIELELKEYIKRYNIARYQRKTSNYILNDLAKHIKRLKRKLKNDKNSS